MRHSEATSIVAYYRVSTKRQGQSGLGLDAQKAMVLSYAERTKVEILREYIEIESGKKADRPQLREALAFAKRAGATLVVSKLDRLARNVAFLAGLMESGVEFICLDNPHANRLTIHLLAAVAEWERQAISERTKAALAEAKARGKLLGSSRPGHWEGFAAEQREEWRRRGNQAARKAISASARREYEDLVPIISQHRVEGRTLDEIARFLNDQGHRTRRKALFKPSTIARILRRAGVTSK